MQATVDAAELFAALDHDVGEPATATGPSRQRSTSAASSRHTEIIDSMQFVERSVRASVGGLPVAAR